MPRRTTLGLALVGGMLVAGLVTPAHATPASEANSRRFTGRVPIAMPLANGQTPHVTCEVEGGTSFPPFNHLYDYWIVGWAFYRDVPGNPMFRQWTDFAFSLDGIPLPGDHSNVNLRLFDGSSAARWEWRSPDSIRARKNYLVEPTSPLYTSTSGVDDVVEFQAIFDRSASSDPRCSTRTPPV